MYDKFIHIQKDIERYRSMLIRKATVDDLDLVTNIEATCFPPAEAAPREAFKERLKYYADHFLIAFDECTPYPATKEYAKINNCTLQTVYNKINNKELYVKLLFKKKLVRNK